MARTFASIFLLLFITQAQAAVSDAELEKYIENGNKQALIKALDSGIDVNKKIGKYQRPLVQIAIIKDQEKIIHELIKRGADLNAKDGEGKTSLHHAALSRSGSIINYLASHGADPGIKDNSGKYPLDIAKEAGKSNNVMVLSVAAMMSKQKGSQAPSAIPPEQQQMMKLIMGKLQGRSTAQTQKKKKPELSKEELNKILVGQWVNPGENHIITFHKNGMFDGARIKNMKWKAVSGHSVSFTENKIAGFGFGKGASVQYKDGKLYFTNSEIVRGEYQRATDALVAKVKASQQQRQVYLTSAFKKESDRNAAIGASSSKYYKEGICNHCMIVPNAYAKGEFYDWTIAKDSDFSQIPSAMWQNMKFNWSDFQGSTFSGTLITKIRFFHANLRNVDFSKASLTDVNFAYADLTGANFRNAVIERALFTGANLTNADFTGATIKYSDFTYSIQTGWKFNAKIDKTVKVNTTDQDKLLAGLWVHKGRKNRSGYLYILKDGIMISSDYTGKVSGRETFISTQGNRLNYRSSEDTSSFSPRDIKVTFVVNKNTLKIRGSQGRSGEYVRASNTDFKKYKIGIYRNSFFDLAKRKQIVFLKELLDNGLSIKESRDNRAPRLTRAVLLGDIDEDDMQISTAYLMKILVEHGMDYQSYIGDRIPVAEAAVRGQLEAMKYLLTIDKREDVVDTALRQVRGKASKEAIEILKHAKSPG